MIITTRVLRGGSWIYDARFVRCASRYAHVPGARAEYCGFRPVAKAILPHILRGSSWLDIQSTLAAQSASPPVVFFKQIKHFGFRPVAKAQQ